MIKTFTTTHFSQTSRTLRRPLVHQLNIGSEKIDLHIKVKLDALLCSPNNGVIREILQYSKSLHKI